MQIGHKLQFHCQSCSCPIAFSVLDPNFFHKMVVCSSCGKKYAFEDETLVRQLKQFEALCRQIHASEEILGSTAIAINLGMQEVKVPFNILLTRLSSVLELKMNGQKFVIEFRVEPLKDIPEAQAELSSSI